MKKFSSILILITLFCITTVQAQKFGVRAGLNYNTILGPTEKSETLTYNNGFHFGINYSYLVSEWFAVRAELGYIQNGYRTKYDGQGFYIIRSAETTTFEKGKLELDIQNSLGYISLPVVATVKLTNKIEINGGVYLNVLASPIGQGLLRFSSNDNPDKITFRQSLVYDYATDRIGHVEGGRRGEGIGVYVDDKVVTLYQSAGAYYQYATNRGKMINAVDFGVTAGIDYFINKGFYLGLSVDYGFGDITNDDVDHRRAELSEDNKFIFDKHHDANFGAKLSVGFRF